MVKRRGTMAALVAALALAGSAGSPAQTVDPRVLQQLQGQLGTSGGNQSTQVSPLDRARDNAAGRDTTQALPGGRIDTPEEQDLRRLEARRSIDRLYRPSPVEREFRDRLSDPTLRQFGYDLFQSVQGSTGPLTGSVSENYVLGVGDEIIVQFQGATSSSNTVRVDREGRLTVAQLPSIRAAGRSLSSVQADLAAATRRTLLGTDVSVSLATVRAATVFVGGEVERPGQVQLTSLADISAALAKVGGIRRSGSLRNVRIVRGGATIVVDLYGLLGIGAPPSIRLRDGDRIIVPVIGDTVAIAGNVARPGIYEIRRGSSVGALLDYAGGALRPRGNAIAISRIAKDGSEEFVRTATLATALIPGDAVQLTGGSAGGALGRVLLRGYVGNPGARSLGAAPTVRDLLGDVRDLRADTYLPMAILIRRDSATAGRIFQPVNLFDALTRSPGVTLRSDDRLYIFSRDDIDFINRTPVRRIVLGQPNPFPECASLDRLEALVRDSQSARFSAVVRNSFVVERGGQSEIAAVGGAGSGQRAESSLRTGGDRVGLAPGQRVPAAGAAAGQLLYDANGNQVDTSRFDARNDRDRLDDLRAITQSAQISRTEGICPAIFEEEPELLPVLIENSVSIGGAVRRPGAYPVAGSLNVRDVAAAAEGLLGTATDLTLDLVRGGESQQRLAVDAGGTTLAATRVAPGDDLRFNAAQPRYEAGGVLLTGEFLRPGLYTVRKGETLSQLIARAGGLSSEAYPYGTVFTRRSVKELQQEGLRRTGRELSNSLLAVSARKEAQGDSLIAAQGLIAQLSSVEVPGRVVVEADPRVLQLRSDLDTVLESGDAIYVPKRPNFVLALGDVNNPGALQFVAGKSARDYIGESGGTQSSADRKRIFVVLPNGTSQPLRGGRNTRGSDNQIVPPGSTIIVPKNIDPLYALDVARDITTIIGTLLTSVATLGILATR